MSSRNWTISRPAESRVSANPMRWVVVPVTALVLVAGLGQGPLSHSVVASPLEPRLVQIAQAGAAEIAFWETVRNSQVAAELEAYLKAYPDGHFATLARLRLKQLQPVVPDSGPDDVAGSGASETRGGMAPFAFDHGLRLSQSGNLEQAIPYLQMAVGQDPEAALYREVLADSYLGLGSRESAFLAVEEYQQVLELEPGSVSALAGLRQAALLADEPLIALDATEALFLHGDEPDLGLLPDLATFYLLLDQTDRGIAKLSEGLSGSERETAAAIELNLAALHRYRGEVEAVARLARSARDRLEAGSELAVLADALIEGAKAP